MVVPGRIALLSTLPNQVRVWDGSKWVLKTTLGWDGTLWKNAVAVYVWDGSQWVPGKL